MGKEKNLPKNSSEPSDDFSGDMDIVSFVVRVWRENVPSGEEKDIWRGHITPIPNGTRHYFTNFNEIPAFMQDYLKSAR